MKLTWWTSVSLCQVGVAARMKVEVYKMVAIPDVWFGDDGTDKKKKWATLAL